MTLADKWTDVSVWVSLQAVPEGLGGRPFNQEVMREAGVREGAGGVANEQSPCGQLGLNPAGTLCGAVRTVPQGHPSQDSGLRHWSPSSGPY